MITLGEAPGGAEFIASLAEAVKALSLLYAGSPDGTASASLDAYIKRIQAGIVEAVGATKAPILLNAFRAAVMGRKREIETGGPSRTTRM
jgi:hypothetical protein